MMKLSIYRLLLIVGLLGFSSCLDSTGKTSKVNLNYKVVIPSEKGVPDSIAVAVEINGSESKTYTYRFSDLKEDGNTYSFIHVISANDGDAVNVLVKVFDADGNILFDENGSITAGDGSDELDVVRNPNKESSEMQSSSLQSSTLQSSILQSSSLQSSSDSKSSASLSSQVVLSSSSIVVSVSSSSVVEKFGGENEFCTQNPLLCGTYTDERDENIYGWVKIGDQRFMSENLKFLPASGYKCREDNDANCQEDGAFYNWETAMAGKKSSKLVPSYVEGVCPAYWHVPSDGEWAALQLYLETQFDPDSSGVYLKSVAGWEPSSGILLPSRNTTGFFGIPVGYFDFQGYILRQNTANWWSTSSESPTTTWGRSLRFDDNGFLRNIVQNVYYLPVRCVASELPVARISENTSKIYLGREVTIDGSTSLGSYDHRTLTYNWSIPGQAFTSTSSVFKFTPNKLGEIDINLSVDDGENTHSVTLHKVVLDTIIDSRDDRTYDYTQIGTQIWMSENLNYSVGDGVKSWCYEDNPINCTKYGRLYNWEAMLNGGNPSNLVPSGVQGLCPDGWHIPSVAEWSTLIAFIKSDYPGSGGFNEALRDSTSWDVAWDSFVNYYGFSAKSGGMMASNGAFHYLGTDEEWWTSSEVDNWDANYISISYKNGDPLQSSYSKSAAYSIRCLKD